MRYLVANVLRKRFTRELRRALPEFRERKARSGVRGTFLYEWRATPALTCYVALVIDDERDRFTVELAWSRSHRFPAQLRQESPDEGARGGAMRFHLRALWQRHRAEPSWSLVARTPAEQELERLLIDPTVPEAAKIALLEARERRSARAGGDPGGEAAHAEEDPVTEALSRIGPAIADVMARLRRYAVPYFARVVDTQGAGPAQVAPSGSALAEPV